ncbi:carbohydrate kinase [Ramlibacter sp. XY19]|uniref:carbohydrate kinase family protein n=1 Tax=Ramlibacter paludis TaxID=2908000 RepID=UPI0023DCA018|nr:carbohydrate kinase [Ramlibacter paludis]MCG2592668.1 carbohydrate kinase [Ramlibacter paludis]
MFLVCGEALMDVFPAGDTSAGLALDARAGGSPFNVAFGLARLGQPVAFAGGISTDAFGQRLLQLLESEGVDLAAVQRFAAPTTLSVVTTDAHGVPAYAFHGAQGADRLLAARPLATLPAHTRVLHVGSYAIVVEPVAATLLRLVEREHARLLVAYDPNVRLNVEPSPARWRSALEWMAERTHLLKLSAEDAALLYPGEEPEALARRWLAQGVRLVVVTQGERGALAFTGQASARVDAVAMPLVDTVGAGDGFQAALLAWLAEHDVLTPQALQALDAGALAVALQFAAQAAAIACSRRGADLARRAELA